LINTFASHSDSPQFIVAERLSVKDLPPSNQRFLSELSEEEYRVNFSDTVNKIYDGSKLRKLFCVLPLYTSQGSIIPIPCLVLTGAPKMIYLGKESWRRLVNSHHIKQDIKCNDLGFHLVGKLQWLGRQVVSPSVDMAPDEFNVQDETGQHDVRANVVGIAAIRSLNILLARKL